MNKPNPESFDIARHYVEKYKVLVSDGRIYEAKTGEEIFYECNNKKFLTIQEAVAASKQFESRDETAYEVQVKQYQKQFIDDSYKEEFY